MNSSTPTTTDATRNEWTLIPAEENNGITWKLTYVEGLDNATIESPDCSDELTIPIEFINELIHGLELAFYDSLSDGWTEQEWRFSVGGGDFTIISREGHYEATLANADTIERLAFGPGLFDLMLPGLDQAGYHFVEEVDTDEGEFQILYQMGEQDHLLRDGERVCPYDAALGQNLEYKRIEGLTEHELSLISNGMTNLCGYCQRFSEKNGIFTDIDSGELPKFSCPDCGDDAMIVEHRPTGGVVEHEGGAEHEFDFAQYEMWRRGNDSVALTK